MADESSFRDWMNRLQLQDEAAAKKVFEIYAKRLIGLARTRLEVAVRRRVDPEDVIQSVFKSFFHRYADGQWELDNWDSVWAMLAHITIRKCGKTAQFAHAARRDIHRETSADRGSDTLGLPIETEAPDPSPDEALMLAELVEQLIRQFKEKEQPIVRMILQGEDAAVISDEVGCSQSKVYRMKRYVTQYLERLRDAGD